MLKNRRAAVVIFALFCSFAWAFAAMAESGFKNSIGMEFRQVPAGSFPLEPSPGGTPKKAATGSVAIEKHFFIGVYEVTQAQWNALMGNNPSAFLGDDRPVENVSWHDAQEFISKLNKLEKTDKYRLPTEDEWEYAARGGTKTRYCFGEEATAIMFYAWYNFNSGGTSHPVGLKKTNAFGLHDVQGNVSEWVQDLYTDEHGAKSPAAASAGAAPFGRRIVRGCSWSNGPALCRSAQRFAFEPYERQPFIGFRLLREID